MRKERWEGPSCPRHLSSTELLPGQMGDGNGKPIYWGRSNRLRWKEDDVQRTKSSNREDPNTQEDTAMGLRKFPLPGPESDRNTTVHLSPDLAFLCYLVLHPTITAQQCQGQRKGERHILTGTVTGNWNGVRKKCFPIEILRFWKALSGPKATVNGSTLPTLLFNFLGQKYTPAGSNKWSNFSSQVI